MWKRKMFIRISDEMKIAKDLILKVFNFLETEYNYTPTFETEKSKVFIESASVRYTHEIRRRIISIHYTKGEVYGEIKYTFSLSIERIPYNGVEDIISFSNYLASLNKNFDKNLHGYFDVIQAESILKKLAENLRHELPDVITGKIWYETYYPRKD